MLSGFQGNHTIKLLVAFPMVSIFICHFVTVVAIGTVTIWNLLTNSWLLKGSHDHCDVGMYAISIVHCDPVTARILFTILLIMNLSIWKCYNIVMDFKDTCLHNLVTRVTRGSHDCNVLLL